MQDSEYLNRIAIEPAKAGFFVPGHSVSLPERTDTR